MIHVRPFRAWRPAAHTAHLVGSRSFLQYSPVELREKLAGNPYSFLHIVHAHHDDAGLDRAAHFYQVRHKFQEFTREGILEREQRPAYYLYEQSCKGFTSTGLIAAVDVADYTAGRIKRHEQTLTAREELFTDYLEHTGINAEPVLLAVPEAPALEEDMERVRSSTPMFDFSTTDQVRHRFWRIDRPDELENIGAHLKAVPALYIADGHHRCASSAGLARRKQAAPGSPMGAFMAILVPVKQLHIYNYDRVVKDLNGMQPAQFLERIQEIGPLQTLALNEGPPPAGSVQFYLGGAWHQLALPAPATGSAVESLDAERLNRHVLGPLLGITDLRTDKRVGFVPGTQGMASLQQKVDSERASVAFHLRAVTFGQLQRVADSGECMPPKTTWIEPKLRSGLTIYSLDDA